MLNPAGLRRFPSPHSSLFFWIFGGIFGLKWGGNERAGAFIGGIPRSPARGATGPLPPAGWAQRPVARGLGDRPLSPVGGATGFFFFQGSHCEFEEKKIHLRPVALWGATGVYFWNISKQIYIFEILIFKKYKKEKTAHFHLFSSGHLSPYKL